MTAEMLGDSPQHLLLVGIVGGCYEAGRSLSDAVRQAAAKAVDAVLEELERLGVEYRRLQSPAEAHIWWSDSKSP
jgi:Ni,Fe-hydrogenase maturation factor